MGRKYSVPYSGTITNAGGDTDLLELLPAANKPCKLLGFILGQTSEVGDTAEESLRLSILRLPATITSGSGGSSVTPTPMSSADTASGATAECNNTTVATTSSSAVTVAELAWNVRSSPFDFWFPPDLAPKAINGEGLFVRLQTTVADDVSFCGTFFFEEE